MFTVAPFLFLEASALGIGALLLVAMPVLAIVLGVASVRRIDRSEGQLRGRGLAIGAIFLGVLSLMAVPLLLVVFVLMRHQPTYSASSGVVVQPVQNNDLLLEDMMPITPSAATSIQDDLKFDDDNIAPVPARVATPAVNPPPATSTKKSSAPSTPKSGPNPSAVKNAEF